MRSYLNTPNLKRDDNHDNPDDFLRVISASLFLPCCPLLLREKPSKCLRNTVTDVSEILMFELDMVALARSEKLGTMREEHSGLEKRAMGTGLLSECANMFFSIAVYVK